jgi:DNA-directed RNA polymerase subunit RPC12/RpoP
MLPQIVCLSCGYHRTWATLVDALADGHRHHAEHTAPETRERRCPACQSQHIVHAGHVIGGGGLIKSEYRCEACGAAFWFVRERVP